MGGVRERQGRGPATAFAWTSCIRCHVCTVAGPALTCPEGLEGREMSCMPHHGALRSSHSAETGLRSRCTPTCPVTAPGAGARLAPGWGRGSGDGALRRGKGGWVPGRQCAQPGVLAWGLSPPSGRPGLGPDRPRLSRWPSVSSLALGAARRKRGTRGAERPGRGRHSAKARPSRGPSPSSTEAPHWGDARLS